MDATDVRGLLGLLLPDGSLVSYRTPAGGYIQLTLTAGVTESAFLEEKVAEFRQFVPTKAEIIPYQTTPRANGKTTTVLRFRVSTNRLRPVFNLLYPGGERCITRTTLGLLGAKAAAWCWAEGGRLLPGGGAHLLRVGNTTSEACLMSNWLSMLTGSTSDIDLQSIRPRLVFSPEQLDKLQKSLASYAPKTRQHLFSSERWDVSSIRSARTELLLGTRTNHTEGSTQAPLAGTQALRN